MISQQDYEEFHESRAQLLGAEVRCVKCLGCGMVLAEDDALTIDDYESYCPGCAKDAGIYRCQWCGHVYEKKSKCPECNTKRGKT